MEIKFENVSYGTVLENININFKKGKITSIIGKNGSGKTHVLNLIYGLNIPTNGQIYIDEFKNNENIEKMKSNIYYLTEDCSSKLFNFNILEDINCMVCKPINKEYLYELLKIFGLTKEILSKNYMEISNGEKKKICLIIMFMNNKDVLLLDNPNSELDNKSIQNLIKLLKKEKKIGKTIILTSNNSEFVLQVSDQVIVLDNKKIIIDDDKYTVLGNESILNRVNIKVPNIIKFENEVLKTKNIRLGYRDNINDLIKDVYRNAK